MYSNKYDSTHTNADIRNTAITDLESFDVLAHLYYLPNGFVPWDKREFGNELPFVYVPVSTTDTTACHCMSIR